MIDRHEVHPHHVLRAVLRDPFVRDLLAELGVASADVQVTLARRWLAASDTIDLEEIETVGVDVATLLAALSPPYDAPVDWGELQLSEPARDLLVGALSARATTRHGRTHSGHLLLALLASRDSIVAGTLAEHGLRLRPVRRLVEKRGRRVD